MKIIIDHQIFSQQAYGGISRYFYEISKHLAQLGNAVEIHSPIFVTKFFHAEDINKPRGIYIKKIPRTAGFFEYINKLLSSLIWSGDDNFDIFHETYYNENHSYFPDKPRITTIHDMIYEKYPANFKNAHDVIQNKKKSIQNCTHIICVSQNTKKDLIQFYNVDEDKVSVVYHGCNFILPDTSKKIIEDPYVLYVGDRGIYKNYKRFVEAFSKSEQLRSDFRIVCFGGGNFTKHELATHKSLGIKKENVIHLNGDNRILANLYKSAVCLVYPSLYEGFGMPALEAMFFGCPVICSNAGSLPEITGNSAERFNPHDVESIRTAIETVVYNPAKLNLLATRGHEHAKLFKWRKCAAETLDVYKLAIQKFKKV